MMNNNDSIRNTPKLGDVWLGTDYVVVETSEDHTVLCSASQPDLSMQMGLPAVEVSDDWYFASAWHLYGKGEGYPPESTDVSPVRATELIVNHNFGEFVEGKAPEITVLGVEYKGHVIRSIELGESFPEFLQRVVSSLEDIIAKEEQQNS